MSAAAIRTTSIFVKYLCRRNDVENNVVLFQCLLAGMLSVFLLKILGADNHPDQHKKEEAYRKLTTIAYERNGHEPNNFCCCLKKQR